MPQVKQQRRRLLRRTRQHQSWITFENNLQSHECQILDISADGAKLVADINAPIGASFRLSAVPQGVVRRLSCSMYVMSIYQIPSIFAVNTNVRRQKSMRLGRNHRLLGAF
jgi:hypothetical protein